jgi:uncharacterized membrane protein
VESDIAIAPRPAGEGASGGGRLSFIDGVRGVALILMVVNHTSRDWLDVSMGWARYHLIYGSLLLPAAMFLFLAGFCLPISFHRHRRAEGFCGEVGKYFRRGIGIIAAGYLLNVIMLPRGGPVPPEDRVWHGGVLQTIGLSIMVLGPLVPALRRRGTRWALLAVAVLIYLSFEWLHASLMRWCAAHPVVGLMAFGDFPPWPWLAVALIGLVQGWVWLEARARGPREETRYFATAAAVGLLFLAAYAAWEWWIPTTPRFGFGRDRGLNHYWTPRGVTTFLMICGVAWTLALCYWLMRVRGWKLPWLVTLGQTALPLYFIHQLIEETLIHRTLGLRFDNWILYWTANVALIVLCVYLGRAWLAVKPRVRALTGLAAT